MSKGEFLPVETCPEMIPQYHPRVHGGHLWFSCPTTFPFTSLQFCFFIVGDLAEMPLKCPNLPSQRGACDPR